MASKPRVVAAAAAAVLTTKYVDEAQRELLDEGQRYFVHPHVATLRPDEAALASYLDDIYDARHAVPLDVASPVGSSGETFMALAAAGDIASSTEAVAQKLCDAMQPKSAKPGILFGFALDLGGSKAGYGIVKADLEEEERFFLQIGEGETWSIGQVDELLPPPQTKYAKYAISPRPRAPGAVGIRDNQADADSAADYFLAAVGLVVPRRRGTKYAVASAAKREGVGDATIRAALASVQTDTPVDDFVDEFFGDQADAIKGALPGTPERPLLSVVADDEYARKFWTQNPRFELIVDETVEVTVSGRTVTVVLPDGADPVESAYVR